MARTTQITFAQVAQIADGMKAAGHRPTARALRERIGSGSMGTIHKLLQQYNGNVIDEREVSELPESIATALMDFLQTEVATACEPIQFLAQENKEAAAALAEENERLENVIERLHHERDNAQREVAEYRGKVIAMSEAYEMLNIERQKIAESNKALSREMDMAVRQIEMLAGLQPELVQTKDALAKSESNRFASEKDAAVLTAQLEAAKRQACDLADRLKASESQARTKDEALKQANAHYQACAARLEEAARTIDELRNKAPTTATKTTKPKTATKKAETSTKSPELVS